MRIVYWNTSCLEPKIEAVSKEVFQLAKHFRNSLIFGINPHYFFRCSLMNGRYIGFNPRFDPILRAIVPAIERRYDINHVYGEPTPWTFYKTLGRKPIVLTIASEKGQLLPDFANRCRKIIVQTDSFRRKILADGVAKEKVELIYPGVNLSQFKPLHKSHCLSNKPETPSLLFATAPRTKEEMAGRGVYLLLDAAKECADFQYHLLYRKWRTGGTSYEHTKNYIESSGIRNVTLTVSAEQDMSTIYNKFHFTIIPYTHPEGGKECPNSVVEGLACGLPVLISSLCPFADFVMKNGCGIIFDPTPGSIVSAVAKGMENYQEMASNAVDTAKKFFSEQILIQRLEQIYQDVSES